MRTGTGVKLGASAWGEVKKAEPKEKPVKIEEPAEKVEKKTEKKRKTTSE